jgi:hypothetical protein
MSKIKEKSLDDSDWDFINSLHQEKKKNPLNTSKHNTETKKYAKLSLSLTNKEKQQIQDYKDKHYQRMSISSMIMDILEKNGVFSIDEELTNV